FPNLATDAAGEIIKRIVNYLFVLSLVAMVLGFAGFLAQIQPKYRPTNDTNKPPVVIPESNLPQNNRTQGSIKVLIEPAEAIEQGAQWKMAQETVWRRSGTSFENLRNGT